jgi:predicted dehydrogenase
MFFLCMAQERKQKIKYGIIGFGGFAERAIAPAIRSSANSELIALQKRSLFSAKLKADEHHVPFAFDSVEELVRHNDVDAVFIASANSRHCPETISAAKAGKHVLVEKPMALNAAEAKNMVDVCKKNRVKLMVGHMVRFSPLTLRIKELIRSGSIGKVTFVRTEYMYDGRTSRRAWLQDIRIAGGGPLFDIGVHCLDTTKFILDAETISVSSLLEPRPTKTRTELTAGIALRFPKGILASIYCSFAAPMRRSMIEVIGTEGTLSAVDFTLGGKTIPLAVTRGLQGSEGETRTEMVNVPNLYVEEITYFSSCILRNMNPDISGEVGLSNQKDLDKAMKGY